MIYTGLVSITFRQLSAREIVALVARAGLDGIEWGGDIHVPHGDLQAAREVSGMTLDAGIRVAAYGSYYVIGGEDALPFNTVLETALELGASTVRVWAGDRGSASADEPYRRRIVGELKRIGELASDAGLTVSCEFHRETLTDTNDSAVRLMRDVSHEAVRSYWQPPVGSDFPYNMKGINALLPWLTHVHVYQWNEDATDRRPLAEGADVWMPYLEAVVSTGREHYAMLEFVRDDNPQAFTQDAAALKAWAEAVNG